MVIGFVSVNLAVINAYVTLAEDFQTIPLHNHGRLLIDANPQRTGLAGKDRR